MTDEPGPDPTTGTADDPPGGGRRRMVWMAVTVVAVAAVGILLAVGLANRGVSSAIDDAIERGDRAEAPDFTLPLLISHAPLDRGEGAEVSLDELRGTPVVLNLWASWCEPCKDEAPLLAAVASRYRGRVVVLGMNVQDLSADGREFARVYGMPFPSVRDGDDSVKNRYGATGVPETFVIDRAGRVAFALRGPLVASGASENMTAFTRILDTVVAEPAPAAETTP